MLRSSRQITSQQQQAQQQSSSKIFSTSSSSSSNNNDKHESPPTKKVPSDALVRVIHHHHPCDQPSTTITSSQTFSKPKSPSKVVIINREQSHSHSRDDKDKNSASKNLSTDFQSLKLESMSTVEEYGAASKTLASALQTNIMFGKQYANNVNNSGGSLVDYNDSDSASSSSSGDERDLTHAIFQEQVKFFCQMKDFLLSQQMALRQQLEALNFKLVKKRRPQTRRRRNLAVQLASSSNTLHIPNASSPHKTEVAPDSEPDIPQDNNIPHFFSCSSTDRSDIFQTCPICGLEFDTQENSDALEEHVLTGHWC